MIRDVPHAELDEEVEYELGVLRGTFISLFNTSQDSVLYDWGFGNEILPIYKTSSAPSCTPAPCDY